MRIHFVYGGDPFVDHLNAPSSITHHLYKHFVQLGCDLVYYDWCHPGGYLPVGPTDVVLGHPNYDHNTIIQRLFRETTTPYKFLIHPLHHAMPEINIPFEPLVRQAKHVFSIMGPYWWDTLSQSRFASWQDKITPVDMAVDADRFPFVRESFPPPGQRQFCYIGNSRPEKGTDILAEVFRRSRYKLHCYGNLDGNICGLPNVVCHGYAHTIPQFGRDLCNTAVMMLNTSKSDANPTTLLETAAWGLVVACTKESGYHGASSPFWGLNKDDPDGIVQLLQYIQGVDEAVLWAQVRAQRKAIELNYTWTRFCETISSKLSTLVPGFPAPQHS
jgi:glycosyltransferase involved in cell wall biosynthesis